MTMQSMSRAECYRFLAACFYTPKKDTITHEVVAALTTNLELASPTAAHFSQKMNSALKQYSEEELTVEYSRLFVGPFGLKAPPYGSVYLDNDRTVMGPSTMATIQFYEAEGLARDENFTELPDHIAVELEFMYFLVYKQIEAQEKGEPDRAQEYQRKQKEFLSRLLANWVPGFCKNIKEDNENAFYIALADCLLEFIQSEATRG